MVWCGGLKNDVWECERKIGVASNSLLQNWLGVGGGDVKNCGGRRGQGLVSHASYLRSALRRHLPDGPAKPRAPQAVGGPSPLLLASLHLSALRLDGPKADPGIFAEEFNPKTLGQGHLGQFAAGGGRALRFVGLDAKGVGGGVVPVEGEGWTA